MHQTNNTQCTLHDTVSNEQCNRSAAFIQTITTIVQQSSTSLVDAGIQHNVHTHKSLVTSTTPAPASFRLQHRQHCLTSLVDKYSSSISVINRYTIGLASPSLNIETVHCRHTVCTHLIARLKQRSTAGIPNSMRRTWILNRLQHAHSL